MTIVTKDGEIITWTIRCKEDLRFLLATPEERDRLLAESFRQMLSHLKPTAKSEELDDHRQDAGDLADGK
jgi:hypothetical protein